MPTRQIVLAVALMAPSVNAHFYAHADSAGTARRAIQAVYDKQDTAMAHLDAAGALVGLAPDFVAFDSGGHRSTLADERQGVTRLYPHLRSMGAKTTILRFTLTGDTVMIRARENSTIAVSLPGGVAPAHYISEEVDQGTWKKTKQGWLLIRSQALLVRTTANGHPLPTTPARALR